MTDPVFVDTNIWVYAVDGRDPGKQERAREVTAPARGRDLVVSTQVLVEFYSVVTRKLAVPLSAADAEAMIRQMAALPVVGIDTSLVGDAVAGCRDWNISIWDALIIRSAAIAGCRTLLTEDLAHGATYGVVTVDNPFRAAG